MFKFTPLAVSVSTMVLAWLVVGCGSGSNVSGGGTGSSAAGGSKKLATGFAQTGAESGWRAAETGPLKDEATKRGISLDFADCQGKVENQIKAIHQSG